MKEFQIEFVVKLAVKGRDDGTIRGRCDLEELSACVFALLDSKLEDQFPQGTRVEVLSLGRPGEKVFVVHRRPKRGWRDVYDGTRGAGASMSSVVKACKSAGYEFFAFNDRIYAITRYSDGVDGAEEVPGMTIKDLE